MFTCPSVRTKSERKGFWLLVYRTEFSEFLLVSHFTMKETTEMELTEQETELYDRQIRLWGLDSQKRLRAARILLVGLNGLGAEVAKNIILAGVKAITLLDDKNLTELDFAAQFLAPREALGKNRAEASAQRAQALNPMVEINTDTSKIADKDADFIKQFDVVCVTEAPTEQLLRLDKICRDADIKFFACDVWGMFGYCFADLKKHEFAVEIMKHKVISKPGEKTKTELIAQTTKRELTYPAFEDALKVDLSYFITPRKLRRSGYGYVLLKVLQKFRDQKERDPLPASREEDIAALKKIRDEIAADVVPDDAFTHVFGQISPGAAVVGGEVAHEIIKTVSQKEAPLHNFFIFDPDRTCGFIELVEPVA